MYIAYFWNTAAKFCAVTYQRLKALRVLCSAAGKWHTYGQGGAQWQAERVLQ